MCAIARSVSSCGGWRWRRALALHACTVPHADGQTAIRCSGCCAWEQALGRSLELRSLPSQGRSLLGLGERGDELLLTDSSLTAQATHVANASIAHPALGQVYHDAIAFSRVSTIVSDLRCLLLQCATIISVRFVFRCYTVRSCMLLLLSCAVRFSLFASSLAR